MKKNLFSITIMALTIMMMSACKSKPVESTENEGTATTATVTLTPEHVEALVNADWDAVPKELLDSMGFVALKSFKQEAQEAQNDNLQYYFGKGASVELDEEGILQKVDVSDENAIVLHLTAESVAYGSIAFRNEADYNDFVAKAQAFIENKKSAGEEEYMEFEAAGKDTDGADDGYESGKWYFVYFTGTM